MQIERIEEMRLTHADDAKIGTLLDLCFDDDFSERSFYQQRHNTRLIVRSGDAVIGHMAISLRAIRVGERLCHAAGLAEVATHPDHRGQGIASRLLDAAIAEARASVADFFMLFGVAPLYAANGFRNQPNTITCVDMRGVRTGDLRQRKNEGVMVMELGNLAWDPTAPIDLVGFPF